MVLVPLPATLKKYGLTEASWRTILDRQGGVCAICGREPKKGRLCIDHEHAKGFKKMNPEEKARHVRGLVCWFDNHYFLAKGVTPEKSRRVTSYLEAYSARNKSKLRPA